MIEIDLETAGKTRLSILLIAVAVSAANALQWESFDTCNVILEDDLGRLLARLAIGFAAQT